MFRKQNPINSTAVLCTTYYDFRALTALALFICRTPRAKQRQTAPENLANMQFLPRLPLSAWYLDKANIFPGLPF